MCLWVAMPMNQPVGPPEPAAAPLEIVVDSARGGGRPHHRLLHSGDALSHHRVDKVRLGGEKMRSLGLFIVRC